MNKQIEYEYYSKLMGRVWKLIPMREEASYTLCSYIKRLQREVTALTEISSCANSNPDVITLACLINGISSTIDFEVYKSDVLRCCNIIEKLKFSCKG